jgi:hypothetical protein
MLAEYHSFVSIRTLARIFGAANVLAWGDLAGLCSGRLQYRACLFLDASRATVGVACDEKARTTYGCHSSGAGDPANLCGHLPGAAGIQSVTLLRRVSTECVAWKSPRARTFALLRMRGKNRDCTYGSSRKDNVRQ